MGFSGEERLPVRIDALAASQGEARRRQAEILGRMKEAQGREDPERVDEVAHELIQVLLEMADRYEEIAGIAESLGTTGGTDEEWLGLAVDARAKAVDLRSLLRDGLELSLTRPLGREGEAS